MKSLQKSARKENAKPLLSTEGFLDQYAVFGNPIHHSLSPIIHQLFAEQTNESLQYSPILAPLHQFGQTLDYFQSINGKGANITLPFKEEAFRLTHYHTERALLAKAVNTIRFHEDGTRTGENTDGLGLIQDLKFNQKQTLTHKKILILGAGGAVRGILGPLLNENPEVIAIANRTENKAQQLVTEFSHLGKVSAYSFAALSEPFDIVINAISENYPPPPSLCHADTFCYDLNYGKEKTYFLIWAREQNKRTCDGLGMLVEQAALSFYFWRNVKPDTQSVLTYLRISAKSAG